MQNHLTNYLLIPYNRFNIGFKDCEGEKRPAEILFREPSDGARRQSLRGGCLFPESAA